MLQNTNQRRNKDDRAENKKEEAELVFIDQTTENKIGADAGIAHQVSEHTRQTRDQVDTRLAVQQNPCQRNLNHQDLQHITQFNTAFVVANQPANTEYHYKTQQEMQNI